MTEGNVFTLLTTRGRGAPHLHPKILPLIHIFFLAGGAPHVHPIILPLVPCPFWGYPSDWSQVPGGGSTPVPGVGYPSARTGTPWQDRMGYTPLSPETGQQNEYLLTKTSLAVPHVRILTYSNCKQNEQ